MPQVGETRSDGKVYTGPKYGWQSPGSAFKKTPAGKPGEEKTIGGVTKVYTGPKFGWQTKETVKARQNPTPPKTPTPPAAPAPTPPAAPTPAPAPGRQPAPSPAPAPSRQPAPPRAPATPAATPQSSALADYTKAAAAARKSGDPAEMAKVRDMGMEIWAKKYKTTLAPKVQPGQSGYETIQKTINPPAPAPTQAPGNEKPGYSGPPTPGTETAPVKPTTKPEDKPVKKTVNSSYEYDAYDLVLEYLFSSGQADTISEAHYVMMQMDAEHIQNIISEQMPVVAQRPQLSARAQALQSGGPSGGPRQLGGGAAAPRPVPVAAAAPAPRPVPVVAAAPAPRPVPVAAAAPAPRQSLAAQAAELRDMQKASQLRQQGQNVMGSNITSVRQSLDAARARDNVQAPVGTALAAQQRSQMQRAGALGAAANPAVRQQLNLPIKAATPTQAIKAAGNPSASASGSVAQASNKFAAAPRPITPNPSGGFSTKPGDGKPYKDGPLWDSDQKPEDVKVNPKPAPTGGYSTRPGDGKPYADGPLWGPGSSDSPSSPARPKPQGKKEPPMRDEPLW
jgi:hypothetical protein